jgi:hypothetical protein
MLSFNRTHSLGSVSCKYSNKHDKRSLFENVFNVYLKIMFKKQNKYEVLLSLF